MRKRAGKYERLLKAMLRGCEIMTAQNGNKYLRERLSGIFISGLTDAQERDLIAIKERMK